jgi:hypothetical protein
VAARHKGILTIMYTCGGSSEITGSLFVHIIGYKLAVWWWCGGCSEVTGSLIVQFIGGWRVLCASNKILHTKDQRLQHIAVIAVINELRTKFAADCN